MRFRVLACLIFGSWILLSTSPLTADRTPPVKAGHSVGSVQDLNLIPSADLLKAPGGIWRHEVHRPGAAFLKPLWQDIHLRSGDALSIFDGKGRLIERFTAETFPSAIAFTYAA